jgi:uncharacterized protein Smg (DUF494 family)
LGWITTGSRAAPLSVVHHERTVQQEKSNCKGFLPFLEQQFITRDSRETRVAKADRFEAELFLIRSRIPLAFPIAKYRLP